MSNPSPTISLTKEAIRQWLQDPDQWPNDSYDLATMQPSDTQLRREEGLRKILPAWCWTGEPGAAMLTIGTGKAYLERKYWSNFDRLYVIDPSEQTRAALEFFPQPNVQYLGASLFNQGVHHQPVAKYAWFGASIHYLFGEFHGWEFMHKLAMMVSDTVVVDAGVFDADTRHGKVFLESWQGDEAFEIHRRAQFSYAAFCETIAGLWEISGEWPTPWIDGRRTLVMSVFNLVQTIGFYGFANWVPTLLMARGIRVTASLEYSFLIAVAAPLGPLIGMYFADRIERLMGVG